MVVGLQLLVLGTQLKNNLQVVAPLSGQVLALECVPDPVFSEHMAGAGLALLPTSIDGAHFVDSADHKNSVNLADSSKQLDSGAVGDLSDPTKPLDTNNSADSAGSNDSATSAGYNESIVSTSSTSHSDSTGSGESTKCIDGTDCGTNGDPDCVTVVSPISGQITVLWPHAFVVKHGEISVLVHLGVDTVKLQGRPFELLVSKGTQVRAGDAIIRWNITQTIQSQTDYTVAITVPEPSAHKIRVHDPASGYRQAGEPLFQVTSI